MSANQNHYSLFSSQGFPFSGTTSWKHELEVNESHGLMPFIWALVCAKAGLSCT